MFYSDQQAAQCAGSGVKVLYLVLTRSGSIIDCSQGLSLDTTRLVEYFKRNERKKASALPVFIAGLVRIIRCNLFILSEEVHRQPEHESCEKLPPANGQENSVEDVVMITPLETLGR